MLRHVDLAHEFAEPILDFAQRAALQRPDVVTAKHAFRLATLGGAEALGLDEEIGSLEVGKHADLAAFALPPGATGSVYDALIFGPRPRTLRTVVAGEERQRDGVVQGVDPAHAALVAEAAERLRRWRHAQTSV